MRRITFMIIQAQIHMKQKKSYEEQGQGSEKRNLIVLQIDPVI